MNSEVVRTILQKLKTQKGIPAKELAILSRGKEFIEFEKKWSCADGLASKPHYHLDEIREMVELGLIDAYLKNGTRLKSGGIHEWNLDQITLFISPNILKIEFLLGSSLTDNPNFIFGEPNRSQNWPDLFMLMPFLPEMKPVYEDHVKKVASELGLRSARADDFFTGKSIIHDVWSAIYHAKVVVADCTGRNPNVFYEIGIAHALGKQSILISQSIGDIPFDLRHLRILIYECTQAGMAKMEIDLTFALTSIRP